MLNLFLLKHAHLSSLALTREKPDIFYTEPYQETIPLVPQCLNLRTQAPPSLSHVLWTLWCKLASKKHVLPADSQMKQKSAIPGPVVPIL